MVEPHTQGGVPGYLVSAIYNFSDYEALDEDATTDCSDRCRPFEQAQGGGKEGGKP